MQITQISPSELIKGRYYVGRGRNGNVGLWDDVHFLVLGWKFDEYVIKHEPDYAEDYGCFQPFLLIDEGEMVEPFGRVGWDAHDGKKVQFKTIE